MTASGHSGGRPAKMLWTRFLEGDFCCGPFRAHLANWAETNNCPGHATRRKQCGGRGKLGTCGVWAKCGAEKTCTNS